MAILVAGALALAPAAGAAQFGYVTGFNDGMIAAGRVQDDGGLVDVAGSPFATGSSSLEAVAISADGRRLFVADYGGDQLRGYSVGAGGGLTELDGSPQPVGSAAYGVAVTPNGRYVYGSAQLDSRIAGFAVAGNGTIAPTAQGTVSAPGPNALVIDGEGKHLFSANVNGTISAFAIAADGSLDEVPGSPFATGLEPYALALAPSGKTLYLADRDDPSAIHAHRIAADGSLTELAGSPYPTGGDNAFSVTVSPDGRNVFAGNYNSNTIAGFDVRRSGALTTQPDSPYAATESPTGLTMSARGEYLYAVSGSTSPQVFSIVDGVPTDPLLMLFGTTGDLQSMALTPAQPPRAKLKAKRRVKAGKKLKLSARRSTDDGDIIEYAWRFGDGKKAVTMGPKVSHKFKRKGRYDVEVTLTDDDGCSTELVTNGQTPYCNGSQRAVATKAVKVKKR